MKRLFACVALAFGVASAYSSTIIWDFAYVDYYYPDSPFLEARADNYRAGCALEITINITPGTPGINEAVALIIAPKSAGASYAMNWRKMEVGDEVGFDTMTGHDKSYFYAAWINDTPYTGLADNDYDIELAEGESVYVGGVARDRYPELHYNYFWLELIFDGTSVQAGQSAIEMGWNTPIFIQPRGVPEPCAAALILVGVCVCALRRKVLRL